MRTFRYLPMSSHHFVKEGQEPALLILEPLSFGTIESLLEWAPLVLVNERSLEVVLSWGIKIDVVLAKPESMSRLTDQLADQAPLSLLSAAPHEEIDIALNYLIAIKQKAVSIFISDPLSMIPALSGFNTSLTLILFSDTSKWTYCPHGVFRKWISGGTVLYGHLVQPEISVIGAEKTESGFLVAGDGMVELTQSQPFWVGETL
jgi:hypothetical protein